MKNKNLFQITKLKKKKGHFSSFRPLLLSKLITFSSLVQIEQTKML
jgi:hypothetical protein